MHYYIALNKGISPEELSIGKEKAYVQCLDPCNYTSGGTVIFEIEVEKMKYYNIPLKLEIDQCKLCFRGNTKKKCRFGNVLFIYMLGLHLSFCKLS